MPGFPPLDLPFSFISSQTTTSRPNIPTYPPPSRLKPKPKPSPSNLRGFLFSPAYSCYPFAITDSMFRVFFVIFSLFRLVRSSLRSPPLLLFSSSPLLSFLSSPLSVSALRLQFLHSFSIQFKELSSNKIIPIFSFLSSSLPSSLLAPVHAPSISHSSVFRHRYAHSSFRWPRWLYMFPKSPVSSIRGFEKEMRGKFVI